MQTYYENVDTFRQILPTFSPDMLHCVWEKKKDLG